MSTKLRRFARSLLLIYHLFRGIFCGAMAHMSRRPEIWSGRFFRGLLRGLNVHVHVHGETPYPGALLAGNHMSWLDIALLVSSHPVLFVSKAEVSRWPLVGWLARGGDTLFIERGAHGTSVLNKSIHDLLADQRSVVIFPEGTTTAGPGVRTFHSRLFAGALDSGTHIQPFALRYSSDKVPYVNDQTLAYNLWQVMGERQIQAELIFGPVMSPPATRKEAAKAVQSWVEQALTAPPRWA